MASELRKSIQPDWRMSCDLAHRLVVREIYEASRENLLPAKERIKHPKVYNTVQMNSIVAIEFPAFFLFHHLYLG